MFFFQPKCATITHVLTSLAKCYARALNPGSAILDIWTKICAILGIPSPLVFFYENPVLESSSFFWVTHDFSHALNFSPISHNISQFYSPISLSLSRNKPSSLPPLQPSCPLPCYAFVYSWVGVYYDLVCMYRCVCVCAWSNCSIWLL